MPTPTVWDICQEHMQRAKRRGVVQGVPPVIWLSVPDAGTQICLRSGMNPAIFYARITQSGQETAGPEWMIERDGTRRAPSSGEGVWRRRTMVPRDIQALATALPLPNLNSVYGYKDRTHGRVTHLLSPWTARPTFPRDLVYVGVYALPGETACLPLFDPRGRTGELTEHLNPTRWWEEVDAGRIVQLDSHIGKSRLPVYWDTGARPARYILVPGKVPWTGVDGPALYLTTKNGVLLQNIPLGQACQQRGLDLRTRFRPVR